MSAIITNRFRVYNASKFKEQFDSGDTTKNLYLFIGKSDPWDNEVSPETTLDTVAEDVKRWYDMISLKKILDTSVSHCIPRHDWDETGDTKYIAYSDNDPDLWNHPTPSEVADAASAGTYTAGSFYVITDEFNVYKCLYNNNNAKSTEKPTGRSTSVIETADGYKWKYMYTVSSAETLKYVTPEWIPVKTLTVDDSSNQWQVQDAAVDGSIDIIKVTNGGSGYSNVIVGGTLAAGASNGGTLPGSASAVDSTYVNATIFITGGTGSGQRRKITTYTGSSRVFVVDSNWSVTPDGTSTFDILPTINITGDGTGALAKATVSGGVITRIDINSAGSGYRSAVVTIEGGGGASATASAVISPLGGHGSDAVQELGGVFVIINIRLEYTESDFPEANDYRRMGIVANVRNHSDNLIATASTRSATYSLSLTSVSGTFLADEIVQSNGTGTPEAHCMEFASGPGATGTLRYYQNSDTGFDAFAAAQTLTGLTSGATATISTVNNPEAKRFSGEILYVENRRPIMRSEEQIEDIKICVEF